MHKSRRHRFLGLFLLGAGLLPASFSALGGDGATLVSQTITNGTPFQARTMFTQVWTVKNTGTTTWEPTQDDYTFNLISWDVLGAITTFSNQSYSWYLPTAIIGSGKAVGPGTNATFSMIFIAPEASGSYTDTFQLNNTSGAYFGPTFTCSITIPTNSGNTNQFDRCRAVSYANNYAGWICSDGYFWTNGCCFDDYGTNVPTPTNLVGDDCAHFVSCCIGREPHQRGGGIYIPSRVPPTYGEPGAPDIVNNILLPCGYATVVSSLSEMEPGDVIVWYWDGDTTIDHVTLYLGNGLLASHAVSALDFSAVSFPGDMTYVWELIHIYDAPTINSEISSNKLIMSWGTNWAGYVLKAATNFGPGAQWTTATNKIGKVGALNMTTNAMTNTAVFYRLELP